jgi:hypothetical protein
MRMVDALTRVSDEGRNRLRKAPGSCQVSFDPEVSECVNTSRFVEISSHEFIV